MGVIFHNRIGDSVARTATTPLADYIADYLIACEAGSAMKRPLTERTVATYGKSLTHLDRLMGHPTLAEFTEVTVSRAISEKRKTSASNAALTARVVKAFSRWLFRRRHTDTHRLDDLGVPTFNGRRRGYTDEELRSILDALNWLPNRTRNRDRAMVLLAIGSGLRSNEMRTLNIEDVHIEKPLSNSWALIRWNTTKTQRERRVRIADDAAVAIHEYIAADRIDREGPLFLSEHGRPYSYQGWGSTWGRIADRLRDLGVKSFGAHRCRHEWASLAARSRMTQPELEQEGGWQRGSKVPAGYIDEIPFEEIQRRPSPLTALLRRVS